MKKIFVILPLLMFLNGCDDGFDMKKYKNYKEDNELSDAVHEWIGDYVSRYCRANNDGSITCR